MKVQKNESPLYERFNNARHGFMKALKNTHLLLMSLSKIRIMIYEGHKKCISFVWALQQCATRFYEGLQNVHLLFMCPSKICITIYEGRKNMHLFSTSASIMCIMVLWRPFKMCISFVWGFQKFAWRFMKVWTICNSATLPVHPCSPRNHPQASPPYSEISPFRCAREYFW